MHTSNISAGGSLPARGEARCNTPETPTKYSVPHQLRAPFAPTLESIGEVAANDIINTNDLYAVSSRLRRERLLDSGNFGGASGSKDRHKPSSGQK